LRAKLWVGKSAIVWRPTPNTYALALSDLSFTTPALAYGFKSHLSPAGSRNSTPGIRLAVSRSSGIPSSITSEARKS